jgi:PAS domain S-box-containing protein
MTAGKKRPEDKNTDPLGSTRSLRDDAEEQLARSKKSSSDLKGQTSEQLIHELKVHQIELETQAGELRLTRVVLEELKDKYLDLYDFAPVGYLTLNDKALITGVNLTGATLLGANPNDILNHGLGRFIAPADLENWDRYFAKVRQHEKKQVCTLTLLREDKTVFPARLEGVRTTGKNGTIAVRITISDIIDISDADKALQESEEKYRTLIDTLNEGIWVIDKNAVTTFVNPKMAMILGYTVEEMTGCSLFSFMDEEGRRICEKNIGRRQQGIKEQHDFEFLKKDGVRIYASLEATPIKGKDGEYLGAIAGVTDITDRKMVEEALRESEVTFRTLIEASPDAIVFSDLEGKVLMQNRMAEILVGYDDGNLETGTNIQTFFTQEELGRLEKNTQIVLEQGSIHNIEYTLIRKDGTHVLVELNSSMVKDPVGGQHRFVTVIRDITKRKQAEEALRGSEDRFRQLFTRMPSAVAIYDGVDGGKDFIIKDFNAAAEKIEGIKKDDIIGKRVTQVFPGVKDFGIFAVFQRVWRTGQFEFFPSTLYRDERDPGTWRENWVYKLANGEVIAIYHDVTERKRAEEVLWQSEKKYRDIFEKSVSGLFKTSADGHLIDANDALAHMYDYSDAAEMLKTDPDIGTHLYANPDDRKEMLRILSEKGIVENYEILHSKRDGTRFWGLITARTIRNEDGTVLFFEGSNVDISERKRVEKALHESARYTRNLIEVSLDPLVTISPEGKITDVNTATELVTGYSRDYLIGTDFSNYFTDLEKAKEGYRKVFDDGVVRDYPLEIRNRDGKTTSVLYNATIYPGESGTKHGVFAAARDITERKVAEEALSQANKKLNLLSSITRHDINNQLTVLMGFLSILKKKQSDPALDEYFMKVGTAAQRISSMIRFTKEYESIGVNAPAWQDCRTVVDTAAKQAPLGQVMVKNDLPAGGEIFADPLVVKVCYNLMDNAVRYGGKITTIRFSVEEHDGDHVVVCEDDGDGVIAVEKEKIFERGFGKNTGLGLALAREILDITGITIKETGEPGKGARFEITVPKGAYRIGSMQ